MDRRSEPIPIRGRCRNIRLVVAHEVIGMREIEPQLAAHLVEERARPDELDRLPAHGWYRQRPPGLKRKTAGLGIGPAKTGPTSPPALSSHQLHAETHAK